MMLFLNMIDLLFVVCLFDLLFLVKVFRIFVAVFVVVSSLLFCWF